MTTPTVAQLRENLNKMGITERKVARIEKQLEVAKAEHQANVDLVLGKVSGEAAATSDDNEGITAKIGSSNE